MTVEIAAVLIAFGLTTFAVLGGFVIKDHHFRLRELESSLNPVRTDLAVMNQLIKYNGEKLDRIEKCLSNLYCVNAWDKEGRPRCREAES